jgi:acyl-coenzyme A thioesterase PaaI-like protein
MPVTTEETVSISARHGHAHCLLCGEHNPSSLNLAFELSDDGTVRAGFLAHWGLQGYADILHGGVIASLLDAAMTHCLFHHGISAVTGELKIRFVESIPCDAPLEIRAWITRAVPPLYVLKSEILLGERIPAWGEAKFMKKE